MAGVTHRFEEQLFVVTCEGTYEVEQLRHAWAAMSDSEEGAQVRGVLVDLRRSASVRHRRVSELRATAGFFAMELARADLSCALLVEGVVRYGLMRMVVSWLPGGVRARVFRDEGVARRWLKSTMHTLA